MLIERQQRESRVRFQHPIRVVTLERQPRVIRTITSNVSRDGLFVRMPDPLPTGTKVALSLEAGGRALALAQAEVVWTGADTTEVTERFPGCGVKFTEFMHPRAEELVRYLVHNLDQGKPLALAPPEKRWMKWFPLAAGVALVACAALAVFVFWGGSEPELEEEVPGLELVAAAPIVHAPSPSPGAVKDVEAAPVIAKEVEAAPVIAKEVEAAPVIAKEVEAAPVIAKEVEAAPVIAKEVEAAPVIAKRVDAAPVIPSEVEGSVPPRAAGGPSTALGATGASAPSTPLGATGVSAPSTPLGATGVSGPSTALGANGPKLALKRTNKPDQQGLVKLPSGSAANLTWTLTGTELRLTPELASGAKLTRAFLLTGPPRAVFDLVGPSPDKSHTAPASPPYASAVRLGKQPTGTRIVIDLDAAPKRTAQDGDALVLSF